VSNPIHRTAAHPCPVCRAELTAASAANAADNVDPPLAGDLTICLHCAIPLRFGADLIPQRLTAYDFSEFDQRTMEELTEMLAAVRFVKRMGKRPT
jgi:hypothetical protein